MAKQKSKQQTSSFWFGIGLVSALLIAPNSSALKVLLETLDPLVANAVRSTILVAVGLPFVLFYWRRFTKKNLLYALGSGLSMSIATIVMLYAVAGSQASYVVLLGLLSPIVLILLSRRIFGEKIKPRAMAGISLAVLGALIAVGTPLILSGHTSTTFYPVATILMLVNAVTFSLGVICMRKAHEHGLPLPADSGVTSMVIGAVSYGALLFTTTDSAGQIAAMDVTDWVLIGYSAVIVIFIARLLNVAAYERIGSVPMSAFSYLSTVVALIIPLMLLGERLPVPMVLGGVVILLGVYLTEKHHTSHLPHLHFFRHH